MYNIINITVYSNLIGLLTSLLFDTNLCKLSDIGQVNNQSKPVLL